jgi:hypothetical protein
MTTGTIVLSSVAGLTCAFYVFVLVKFARDRYHQLLKRRTPSLTPL